MVREAVEKQQTDEDLAKSLHRLRLGEKLDDRAAEELESEAPGPLAVLELEQLRYVSREMREPAVPPRFAEPPDPDMAEQREALTEAGKRARVYGNSLPDFLCKQTIRRYQAPFATADLSLRDTLTVQLSYVGRQETGKLIAVNGRPVNGPLSDVGGTFSTGEFSSVLLSLFSPESAADFQWDHWTNLRKRSSYVFRFRIIRSNSAYKLVSVSPFGKQVSAVVGRHGFVYIDRESRQVIRVVASADTIPEGFPLRMASSEVDYGLATVGGSEFLLPFGADVRMVSNSDPPVTRNVIQFDDFRKFSSKSTLSFEDDSASTKKK